MTALLNTQGHRLSTPLVRAAGAAMGLVLVASVITESRIGGLAAILGLGLFAGWVGMGQTRYEVTPDSVRFFAALRSTHFRRDDVRGVTWDRDEFNIEELTIHGDQGRAIVVSRSDLAGHPGFAEELLGFLASVPTVDVERIGIFASKGVHTGAVAGPAAQALAEPSAVAGPAVRALAERDSPVRSESTLSFAG